MAVPRQTWHLSDAGILRKKEEDDELLVFGYSCKIFRDDEKALFIDQGKHLIPWMGDETLKIDRYDGRAALADLRECEAPTGGYDLWASLSDAERRVEQLCDEERYRALTHNEEEEALYQEEELKRLQQALSAENTYGQVAYQYDESGQPVGELKPEGSGDPAGPATEEDEPFVAPQELDIPLNMILPETVKANAIIEKTAMFISEQGAQMEILLKMKQAKNPQFQFLSFDDPLHSYYRHLLMAIKTGRYRPKPPKEEDDDEGDPDDEDDGYYLHPSLASSASRIELAPSIPSINYKPSADCAYSMLVNKIRDKQAAFVTTEENAAVPVTAPVVPASLATIAGQSDPESAEDEDGEEDSEQVGYGSHRSTREESASRQAKGDAIVSGPVMGVGRKRRKRRGARRKRRSSGGAEKVDSTSAVVVPPHMEPPPEMQIVIDKMASYVAKNGRDFETIVKSKGDPRFSFLETNHQFNTYYRMRLQQYELQNAPQIAAQEVHHPSPAKKPKNGPDKVTDGEQKFDLSKQEEQPKGTSQDKESPKSAAKLAPVCFSIKKPKEVEILPLEKRSALLLEESSEDGEGEEEGEGRAEMAGEETESNVRVKQVPAERVEQYQLYIEPADESNDVDFSRVVPMAAEVKKEPVVLEEEAEGTDENLVESVVVKSEVEKIEVDTTATVVEQNIVSVKDPSTPPPVVDEIEAEKDMFLEFADSNSPAGLSPTAAANRERHLQQERKRKAAIFLRMIKKEHPPDSAAKPPQSSHVPDAASKTNPAIETIVVDDDDSYASIPSSPVMSVSKTTLPTAPLVRKEEWGFSSPAVGGHNGVSSYANRDKPYRKPYTSENDGHEESSMFHRRHHHHHRSHKHKHRKEIAAPMSPPSIHKRAQSRSRSKSKTRADRPRNEGSSVSKHKKGKKKKTRSRSRSSSRRHSSVQSHHHHHKKNKHHSRHKGRRRDRDNAEFVDEHQSRRVRSRSRERRHMEKPERRKAPEVVVEDSQASKSERRRKEGSSSRSSEGRTTGSESSDSRDSGR